MKYEPDYFIEEIYELESSGMLADLALNISLFTHFIDFDDSDRERGISYIKSVLEECYKAGHLRVAISHENKTLYGYAMMFVHPDPTIPKYLHKIYVKEPYRGHGIGAQILTSLSENESLISLICPSDKIEFYEKYGFQYIQNFEVPENDNFLLSKGMYSGLSIMNNHSEPIGAPIFFLNDKDIKAIIGTKI